MDNDTRIVCALVCGLAAGVAIGLLCAPASGSETRDQLISKIDELGNSIRKYLEKEPSTGAPEDQEHA